MSSHIKLDGWKIIEEGFHPEKNRVSESLFSLGNGRMGVRGNFEETYSGDTLPGSYIGGIYYPEPIKAGAHPVGLPRYYTKMPNAANWIGVHVEIDGEELDLAVSEVQEFRRILHMKEGWLERFCRVRMHSGKELEIHAKRFCSMAEDELGVVYYKITPLNFSGTLTLTPSIDLNVRNEEAEVEERFWVEVETQVRRTHAHIVAETRKTEFQVCTSMKLQIFQGGEERNFNSYRIHREKFVACSVDLPCKEEQATVLVKYAANLSSLNHPKDGLLERAKQLVKQSYKQGFDQLFEAHRQIWAEKWEACDIEIEGDLAAQQGIRFNLFHLLQAYTGKEERLSIPPKGFTGERYGGCIFWSAEGFGLPFFLHTHDPSVSRQLLLYRYRQLPEAINNAEMLGFGEGAALFPLITINGEECSPDWEFALEEIHRNGIIAYAISDYVRYTGDKDYLIDYGLETLIAIARFWAQRVHWSEQIRRYVIHGVTGPNEYENNVNNNWYTNYLAAWCLKYAIDVWQYVREEAPDKFRALSERIKFYEYTETNHWKEIIQQMYFPSREDSDIIPQQDGFFEKALNAVDTLDPEQRPLYRYWSWDRILRSAYVKRADVLQGLCLFEDRFERAILRRNYDFYAPLTVHESSLSAPVYAVVAARSGYNDEAYSFFMHSARLDLEDRNEDTARGCHVTGMAGTWIALIRGMAGLRTQGGRLSINPFVPEKWDAYRFRIQYRGCPLEVRIGRQEIQILNDGEKTIELLINGESTDIPPNSHTAVAREAPKSTGD